MAAAKARCSQVHSAVREHVSLDCLAKSASSWTDGVFKANLSPWRSRHRQTNSECLKLILTLILVFTGLETCCPTCCNVVLKVKEDETVQGVIVGARGVLSQSRPFLNNVVQQTGCSIRQHLQQEATCETAFTVDSGVLAVVGFRF